jgi:hypothetical protein
MAQSVLYLNYCYIDFYSWPVQRKIPSIQPETGGIASRMTPVPRV